MKILIVKLGAVGDVVHTLPSLRSLRETFPDAYIAWIVEEKSKDVITGNPGLDELIVFERKRIQKGLRGWKTFVPSLRETAGLIRRIRGHSFDIAVDFQTLFKSGLITYLSGAKKRIGFDKWRELNRLFTNLRVKSQREHAVDKYLELVEAIGARPDPAPVKIKYSAEDELYVKEFMEKEGLNGKRWAALNPGASWPSKLWGCERYALLCDSLADAGIPVVIIWGPGEEGLVGDIMRQAKSRPVVAPKTSIKQLASLLEKAGLYVGGDTGPLHISVAMGTQVVGIYGPSDPKRNGPYGEGHRVLQADVKCASCWKRSCGKMECMEKVTVDEVVRAVKEQIHASTGSA
jgi:lipopolysaccharide heptosyltransferase I